MIIGLIPARYNSTRLEGKPLLIFGNKTMIQKVYEQSIKSKYIDKVYVVTDNIKIKKNIEDINGNVLMITDKCLNGTERICLAINKFPQLFKDSKYIVNIQGDEPYIDPLNIDIAIKKLINSSNDTIKCSTLHYKIENNNDLQDLSIGKLVLNKNNYILYCSRNCIPSNKNNTYNTNNCDYYGHIGLFVFTKEYLQNHFLNINMPLQLEEDIEWLKIIEQGFQIISSCVQNYEKGVNTIEDYNYLILKYSQ
jgi:3-deoxy-manno-octulosonate cytidylyltransferase (CMP-KDO synthetase)